MHDYDVLTRRAVFRNDDNRSLFSTGASNFPDISPAPDASPRDEDCLKATQSMPDREVKTEYTNTKVIQKACSVTIDFDRASDPFYLIHTSGRSVEF
mmetsp:Transcript_2043/g.2821  ORF Transcript_2043/g.2821 Transcript_2043/m.2821 type:complete len:97 (-) Transcript_2043:30-320(-)